MKLKSNIGIRDKNIRLAIALILLVYGIFAPSIIALGLSIFTFFEVANSWCVLYYLMGKNTCPINRKR